MAYLQLMAVVCFLLFQISMLVGGQRVHYNNSNIIKPGSCLASQGQHPSFWLSPSGNFAFGFYRQGNGFAVGIWLVNKTQNLVVWTAKRDGQLVPASSSCQLNFTEQGWLTLLTDHVERLVYDYDNRKGILAASASMLDCGNFVIYKKTGGILWQSFYEPTDAILGGQNLTSYLVSSTSTSNHSSGRFILRMQSDGNLVAYPVNSPFNPEDAYYSSGTEGSDDLNILSLNSRGHLCIVNRNTNVIAKAIANVSHPEDTTLTTSTIIYRATLDPDGNFRLYSHTLIVNKSTWTTKVEWSSLQFPCQAKDICGVNSYCSSGNKSNSVPDCICFPGFMYFNSAMKSLGCGRSFIDEQDCLQHEEAVPVLPLSYNITEVEKVELFGNMRYSVGNKHGKDDCKLSCFKDCNCWIASYTKGTCNKYKLPILYALKDYSSSSIVFVKQSLITNYSQAPTPKISVNVIFDNKRQFISVLALSLGVLAILCSVVAFVSFFYYRQRAQTYRKLSKRAPHNHQDINGSEFTLRSFSYAELEKATNMFKDVVGKNYFGSVYKGAIDNGTKFVAVKRLEKVVEGEGEFLAEMTAIGRTHHRNLVELLGFCIEGTKKLLVYEFVEYGSLANLLFKAEKKPSWKDRVRIAVDVAKGILYLHEECETRIIHCNLKPQNILIDCSWTAKITDFGLAKLLLPNQDGAATLTRVRGTLGYLAPEWNTNVVISEKVDVYSYGAVLLEIICCRSIMDVNASTADEILLSTWVYICYARGQLDKLVSEDDDEVIINMKSLERMVKIALLCLQDDPNLRPSMKNVILMIQGHVNIPNPSPPNSCSVSNTS